MATQRSDKQLLDEILQGMQVPGPNAAASFIDASNLIATDDGDSEAGGSTGTGSPGSTEPLMDMSVFGLTESTEFLLAQAIRKGESRFGLPPATKDPSKKRQGLGAGNQGPQSHPLLSENQRFDGASPKDALPVDSPEASENYAQKVEELRLEAKLTNTNTPAPAAKAAPTFRPM
jgi:hypothetical protein